MPHSQKTKIKRFNKIGSRVRFVSPNNGREFYYVVTTLLAINSIFDPNIYREGEMKQDNSIGA